MRLASAVIVSLLLLVSSACHVKQKATAKVAIDSLHKVRVTTAWNAQSAKMADVNCDSKPDTIVLGSEKGMVIVGIAWGASNQQPQVFAFPIRPDKHDGFCAAPKSVDIESLDCESDSGTLPGCKVAKGCQAFSLNDMECDPFNFYWNADAKQLAWWRL